MKNLLKLAFVSLLIMGTSVFAQSANVLKQFKAYGACGMCEKRIEKAAKSVDGVETAEWDKETKMIKVSFDAEKTDLDKIQKAVTDVGHDTDKYTADDAVYEKLHSCCKYERKADNHGHSHDHEGEHKHKH